MFELFSASTFTSESVLPTLRETERERDRFGTDWGKLSNNLYDYRGIAVINLLLVYNLMKYVCQTEVNL